MKVILKDLVPDLGHPGDVVQVADGYARNFLIPRGLAIRATFNSIKERDHHMKLLQAKKDQLMASCEGLVSAIEKFECEIPRKVKEGEEIYGSVTAVNIESVLKSANIDVDRKHIVIAKPIKTLGLHEVVVKTNMGIPATLKIQVVEEEDGDE